ncbi:hypothetical protein KIN34_14450 [Cellulomonas sp. DKR-3]|uniref:Uncharacterized protein n=1 Tax=Cellulomonas fulva TaxID=2835530 RepID=A0ABS5U262_9CELL|nr:hypothetical protein [Cellulomonas fulva]MBT0995484.1 hypothetical protein [Cellulomonas fulva]
MAHLIPRTADEWTALATWITVGIAAVAAWVGLSQAVEARDLRIEQAQPYVVATMEPNPSGPETIELAIRNTGNTPARNVVVQSTPPLRATGDGDAVRDVWLPDSIPYLAPRQEWRTSWDFAGARLSHPALKDEDRHDLAIQFDGIPGTPRQTTTAVLDWAAHKGRAYLERKTLHHAATALMRVSTTLEKWTDSPRGGLAVFTRDGDAKDERRSEQHAKLQRQHQRVVERLEAERAEDSDGPPTTPGFEPTGDTT